MKFEFILSRVAVVPQHKGASRAARAERFLKHLGVGCKSFAGFRQTPDFSGFPESVFGTYHTTEVSEKKISQSKPKTVGVQKYCCLLPGTAVW